MFKHRNHKPSPIQRARCVSNANLTYPSRAGRKRSAVSGASRFSVRDRERPLTHPAPRPPANSSKLVYTLLKLNQFSLIIIHLSWSDFGRQWSRTTAYLLAGNIPPAIFILSDYARELLNLRHSPYLKLSRFLLLTVQTALFTLSLPNPDVDCDPSVRKNSLQKREALPMGSCLSLLRR